MHQATGLVGIIAVSDVLPDERQHAARVIVEGNAGHGARRIFRFFFKERDPALGVHGDGIIVPDLVEVAHIVHRQHRRILFPTEHSESLQRLAEQVVAGHHDEVAVHVFTVDDQVQIADGAKLVGVIGRTVIDDGEIEVRPGRAIVLRPFLEVAGELCVGHDIDPLEPADGREVVQHVFDHRPAGHGQQRFGLR